VKTNDPIPQRSGILSTTAERKADLLVSSVDHMTEKRPDAGEKGVRKEDRADASEDEYAKDPRRAHVNRQDSWCRFFGDKL